MNAWYMLTDLRDNVAEATEKRWHDNDLLRKLNFAHRMRANELIASPGDWLVTSEDLTPSSGVVTLPSDCLKPVYMEEISTGYPIPLTQNLRDRRTTRTSSYGLYKGYLDAYVVGNTIEINSATYGTQVRLWYQRRVADLHCGTADTGTGASALVLDNDMEPRFEDDYYNGVYVEVIDQTSGMVDIRSLVTDYVAATETMTITGTAAADDHYGTVLELPEECAGLIVLEATLLALAKPASSLDTRYFEFFESLHRKALKDWNMFKATRVSGSNMTRVTEVY